MSKVKKTSSDVMWFSMSWFKKAKSEVYLEYFKSSFPKDPSFPTEGKLKLYDAVSKRIDKLFKKMSNDGVAVFNQEGFEKYIDLFIPNYADEKKKYDKVLAKMPGKMSKLGKYIKVNNSGIKTIKKDAMESMLNAVKVLIAMFFTSTMIIAKNYKSKSLNMKIVNSVLEMM